MKTIETTSTRELLAQKTGFPAKEYDLIFESTQNHGSDKHRVYIYFGNYEGEYLVVLRCSKNDVEVMQCKTYDDAVSKAAQLIIEAAN